MSTRRLIHAVGVCVTLLLPLLPASAQETPTCTTKASESTDKTTITCDNQEIDVLNEPNTNILHAVAALSHTGDDSNALSLVTGSASSQFARVDTARALIDGERHTFQASYTNGRTKAGIAIEQVVVVLPAEQTTAIRAADTFWIRLDTAVFDLAPMTDQMKHIQDMRTETEPSR